ncbi:MAG: PhoH family protein [Atopobiaceae bacterium]|jgi:phosphate starvation-inducible PhoH-like protein|nr:PhoH family protein [Atopobiaceae bacterium]PWM34709.1 MAG: phosphate starvation-inducible protein PhoH [Coriobacteriia bacterium]
MEPTHVRLTIPDSIDPTELMGPADALLRRVEGAFDAMVAVRGNHISLTGEADEVELATSVFSRMIRLVEAGDGLTTDDVDLLIDRVRHGAQRMDVLADDVLLTFRGRAIRPKTAGQKRYVDSIRRNTITFGVGPAGTGKTYLAMAMAVAALKRKEVGRIVLARPVVEAGESLGFLPGTLQEKLDPYVRPLYDALFDMTDMERGNSLIEQGVIEIAPLAFMRGRTMNDAFVILDEAQNTTPEQMKMFLTRLGFNSKFVVTGDASQKDLKGASGLDHARRVLAGVDDISFIDLDRNDIVRHTLVARIVDAYNAAAQKGPEAGRRPSPLGQDIEPKEA